MASTISSTARVAAGSRLAVGSSRNSTCGFESPCARQRQLLLFAEGQHARGLLGEAPEAGQSENLLHRSRPLPPRNAAQGQRVFHVGGDGAPQHHRPLKDHRLMARRIDALARCPQDAAGGGPKQAVAEPEQQALAGPVRSDDDADKTGVERAGNLLDQPFASSLEGYRLQAQRQDRALVG